MKHKNKKKKYFQLMQNLNAGTADIFIFGDITSWEWLESDVSSYTLARAIQDLAADEITVHINSYGGEVAEGLAIYNNLKNHRARVRTICDGFACSAASVVFMAGDERVMNPASLLMIHNAWSSASGNAKELRKAADDLEVISATAAETYRAKINIPEEHLTELLDNESWITPADALSWGFATEVLEDEAVETPSQSARMAVFQALTGCGPSCVDHTAENPTGVIYTGTISFAEIEEKPNLSTFLSALTRGGKE